jgi:hypothetical protein
VKLIAREREHVEIVETELKEAGVKDWTMRRTKRSHVLIEWTHKGRYGSILVSRGSGPTSQKKIGADIRRRLSDRQPSTLRHN